MADRSLFTHSRSSLNPSSVFLNFFVLLSFCSCSIFILPIQQSKYSFETSIPIHCFIITIVLRLRDKASYHLYSQYAGCLAPWVLFRIGEAEEWRIFLFSAYQSTTCNKIFRPLLSLFSKETYSISNIRVTKTQEKNDASPHRLKRARRSFQPNAQLSATRGCKRSMELPSENVISAFCV